MADNVVDDGDDSYDCHDKVRLGLMFYHVVNK